MSRPLTITAVNDRYTAAGNSLPDVINDIQTHINNGWLTNGDLTEDLTGRHEQNLIKPATYP